MAKELLISVIIPIYNTEKYLKKCLKSVINQSYKNLEIILVNDGSTDNSTVICNDFADKDSRIKVIHCKNQGVSTARNIGIDLAKGDYINFLDSDDWLEQDTYENLVNCVIQYKVEVILFEYLINFENGEEIIKTHKRYHGYISKEEAISITIAPINRFSVTKLYKKNILKNIRYSQHIYIGEDTLFACEAIKEASQIYYLSKPLYHYLQSSNSATRSVFNERKLTGIKAYSQLLKMCETSFPKIIYIAKEAYILLLINTLVDVARSQSFPNQKKILKNLMSVLRKNKSFILSSNQVPIKSKIKFASCYIGPKFYYLTRKIFL